MWKFPLLVKPWLGGIVVEAGHVISALGATFAMGFAMYLEQWLTSQTGATLVQTLHDPNALRAAVAAAVVAGLSSVLLLAKQSWLQPVAPTGVSLKKTPPFPNPPSSPTLSRTLAFVMAVMLVPAFMIASLSSLEGCANPAVQALLSNVEQLVLNDLAAGKSRADILADVGKLVAGQPGADVGLILADALQVLIDLHVIPANILGRAHTMLAEQRLANAPPGGRE